MELVSVGTFQRWPCKRADTVIAERGLTRSRAGAAEAIRAGRVLIGTGGTRVAKPSELIEPDAELSVTEDRPYVSRGGIKLANALDTLGLDVTGMDCLDVGASTGGFTDCLLQRGAARVIALDVAHGQLEWSMRNDERVHVIERTNARSIVPADLPFEPGLATIDVSFISLAKVMPAVAECVAPDGHVLAMVKPQFELGRARVKAGVVQGRGRSARGARGCGDSGSRDGARRPGVRLVGAAGAQGEPRDVHVG